ncbi:MAG: DNA-3-methyladenine glycosylase 2 family protein [Chloroflexi bacterium]|nr:DNA-3-methyladenine glycosylase 2 family protein [Chloroflexota bacterium]
MLSALTDVTLPGALSALTARDARLARIVADYGPPPLWAREPGFPTLLHIILEQQVSLASARAAFDKLREAASPLTPERFLELDDVTLKAVGFSRQKTRYGRELAQAIRSGSLDLGVLHTLDDEAVRAALTRVVGIGRWTADIYLLMALGRPDVWPAGDLALATAARHAFGLEAAPDPAALEALGEPWRPWRAVAARVLWHFYLSAGAKKHNEIGLEPSGGFSPTKASIPER